MMSAPLIGQPAPDFVLPDQSGEMVSLAGLRGRIVVMFFYPSVFTPACTAEACSFRDEHGSFAELGASVIGVSGNGGKAQSAFASVLKLPYLLLSDTDGSVRRRYGVHRSLLLMPGRVSFVIDQRGVLRHRFDSQIRATAHAQKALAIVKKLAQTPG